MAQNLKTLVRCVDWNVILKWNLKKYSKICVLYVGWDSSVSIVARCRLDIPGIETHWWARFSATVQNGSGAYPAFYTMRTG